MVRILVLVGVVGLVGCGGGSSDAFDAGAGVNWPGSYSGPASAGGTCSDGSTVPTQNFTFPLALTESGSTVSYIAKCGATVIADVAGNAATIRQVTCPPIGLDAGGTETVSVTSGTFTLNGNSLAIDYNESVVISTGGTCTVTTTGTLVRQ